jgi:maltoporin
MNDFTEENIQASIDVNDLDVGTKKVKVSVTTSDDLDIQLISSKEISINIERN